MALVRDFACRLQRGVLARYRRDCAYDVAARESLIMSDTVPNATRGPRPALPGTQPADARDIEAMIRVDHAGEFGALRIYEGQLAVLSRTHPQSADVAAIRQMAAQEQKHFDVFDRMIKDRAERPTALEPVWHAAGFALGAATALMGE